MPDINSPNPNFDRSSFLTGEVTGLRDKEGGQKNINSLVRVTEKAAEDGIMSKQEFRSLAKVVGYDLPKDFKISDLPGLDSKGKEAIRELFANPSPENTTAAIPALRKSLDSMIRANSQVSVPPQELQPQPESNSVTKTWGTKPEKDLPVLSEKEIKALFKEKIFPAIKEALQAQGLSVNESRCNTSAAYTMIALEKLGIGGAELSNTMTHITVKLKTSEGKTLIIDPTMAQFFADGSKIDKEMNDTGFIGTETELKDLFKTNAENWDYTQHKSGVLPFNTFTKEQEAGLKFLNDVKTGKVSASQQEIDKTIDSLRSSRVLGSDDGIEKAGSIYQDHITHNEDKKAAFKLLMGVYRGETNPSALEMEKALMTLEGSYEKLPDDYQPMDKKDLKVLINEKMKSIAEMYINQDFAGNSSGGFLIESSKNIVDSYHGLRSIRSDNGESKGMDRLVGGLN
jgi:hypothetical protein